MYGKLVGLALSDVVSIKKGLLPTGLPRPVRLIRAIFLSSSNGQFLAAVTGPSLLHGISLCQLGGLSEEQASPYYSVISRPPDARRGAGGALMS